jgi:DNA topoisomerase-1
VIVESPSKCQTIAKILATYVKDNSLAYDFQVSSSMGHIRNLPKSDTSKKKKEKQIKPNGKFPYTIAGIDLENGYQPEYVLLPGKGPLVKELQQLAANAELVLLATDPDREGEAIAWHLTQVLDLAPSRYQRVTFTEITPSRILEAVESPVELNTNLVHAQETRRVLDRLAGYTVSPVLWKKIAPGLSAGRVQSVGMAMVVQRERERLCFETTPYWNIKAVLGDNVNATLHAVNGTTIAAAGKDFSPQGQTLRPGSSHKRHLLEGDANELVKVLSDAEFTVIQVKSTTRKQQPPQPFKTSTLQQEANRRLGMAVQQTMRVAQQLYEEGLISYMRTDSTHLSDDAECAIGVSVRGQFGPDRLWVGSSKTKRKPKDSKFAQEAHEAIRPALQPDGIFLEPRYLLQKVALSDQAERLYTMIYQRTLACRMPPIATNQTSVLIAGVQEGTTAHFRVSGSVVIDPGYTLAYCRDAEEENDEAYLPALREGQILNAGEILAVAHETQPPPRYNEASFVKELESLGVGRPSTYSGIVQILRDRAYVGSPRGDSAPRKSSKVVSGPAISAQRAAGGADFVGNAAARGPMVPSLSAFVVCSLLEKHCPAYVDPSFTARMEEQLDSIASGDRAGHLQRIAYLDEFYSGEKGLAAKIKRIEDTVDANEARRANLPTLNLDSRQNRKERAGAKVGLFVGPWGPYVQKDQELHVVEKPVSASLPPSMAADLSKITPGALVALLNAKQDGGLILGKHMKDDRNIRLKTGRYGAFLQWGDDGDKGTTTHSLPREKSSMQIGDGTVSDTRSLAFMIDLTLDEAIGYVSLPRTVSMLNDLPIVAAIGPYGPYLKYNNTFISLSQEDGDVLTVSAVIAENLVTDNLFKKSSKTARGVLAELGEKDGNLVTVKSGRFGMYVNWKRINVKMPSEYLESPGDLPLTEAWDLVQAKFDASGNGDGIHSTKSSKPRSKGSQELPAAPKRPLSAYLHFCAENRPQMTRTGKTLGEISKVLAKMWSETTVDDRKQFNAMAVESKRDYEERKRAWEGTCRQLQGDDNGHSSSRGRKRSVRRTKSAYFHFCAAKRRDVARSFKSLGDVSKELARLWAATTDRSEFEALAAAEKALDEVEGLPAAEKACSNDAGAKVDSSLLEMEFFEKSVTTKRSYSTMSSSKPHRPLSAYMLFCREFRPTIVDCNNEKLPFGETAKRLALLWRECDDSTKAEFQRLAAERSREN